MSSDDRKASEAHRLLAALAAGGVPAAYFFILAQLFPRLDSVFQYFLLCLIPSALFGFALGRYASALLISFCVFVGTEVGVIVNAIYDFKVRHVDHNLIPIEFLLVLILFMPGLLCGLAAMALKKQRANSN
jgi:hypothetical protein